MVEFIDLARPPDEFYLVMADDPGARRLIGAVANNRPTFPLRDLQRRAERDFHCFPYVAVPKDRMEELGYDWGQGNVFLVRNRRIHMG